MLVQFLEENHFKHPRVISGVICAISSFNFTTGLVVDIRVESYGRRYCYESPAEALKALAAYSDAADHPTGPWIKCKGIHKGELIDLINPLFG